MHLTASKTGTPRIQFETTDPQWEKWILVTSDIHWDSPHCDRAKLKRHLDRAVERDALWFDLGDFWDAMQGRNDNRRSYKGLREDYLGKPLWQAMIDEAEEELKPYFGMLVIAGRGNHEAAVLKHNDLDLTRALLDAANRNGGRALPFGYTGYVQLKMRKHTVHSNLNILLTHGYGGGGAVTQGVMQGQRRSVYAASADLIISGHIHEMRANRFDKLVINTQGNESIQRRWDIVIPGYKQEFTINKHPRAGFHLERGAPPKPTGAVWLRLHLQPGRSRIGHGQPIVYDWQFAE